MLVPLETLAGWPAAPDPSPLVVLGLLVGLPALVCAAVVAIARIGNLAKASRGDTVQVTDPVWVGGPSRPDIEGPRHDQAAIEADKIVDHPGPTDDTGAAGRPGNDLGGAGARW